MKYRPRRRARPASGSSQCPRLTGRTAAPLGIISFELAGDLATARQMIGSWDEPAREHALLGLGLDFLFLALYSTTIGLACVWAAGVFRTRRWPLAAVGLSLAWGQWLA